MFFVEPKDGATVKSPVHLMFGIENFEIAPVPAGTVESVRPNIGHHHVGVDADCLPPGTEIPRASPWVHFGKGDNMIDMQLPPGPHKLALEIGDDKHTTIAGLCPRSTSLSPLSDRPGASGDVLAGHGPDFPEPPGLVLLLIMTRV